MSDGTKRQVCEMSVGILLHNLILSGICLIWFREASVFIGILIGMIIAIGLLCSIAISTEICVEFGEKEYARKKMVSHAILRSLATVAIVGLLWKFTPVNILAVAIATLGMKTGSYLYPWVHKILNHKADSQ